MKLKILKALQIFFAGMIVFSLVGIVIVALASCGGGGTEDPEKTAMPVDCAASAKACT